MQDQNEAVYGQATWHITDDLDLTGGARYTYDRKSGGSPVDTSHLPQTLPAGVTNAQLNTFYKAIGAIFVNPGVSYTTPGFYTTGTASVPAATGYPLNVSTKVRQSFRLRQRVLQNHAGCDGLYRFRQRLSGRRPGSQ